MTDPANPGARRSGVALLLAAFVLLGVLLQFPGHPADFRLDHFLEVPLELPIILLSLLLLRGRWFDLARALIILALVTLMLLRVADIGSELAFGRRFSPIAEWHLIGHGWSLAANSVGRWEAGMVALLSVMVLATVALLIYRGLGQLQERRSTAYGATQAGLSRLLRQRLGIAAGILLAGNLALTLLLPEGSRWPTLPVVAAQELPERLASTQRSVADQLAFQELLANDPIAVASPPSFSALQGLDVIVLFVESYGRSYLDHPRYRDRAAATLERFDTALTNSNLAVSSGWLTSPVRGGRSWLAHGTLASGLPLTNHARFDRLITSDRRPLWSLFENAGWSTAVTLPAVRSEWVEGNWYDVDRFFDAEALEYQGQDFGYVTMPDQYTLAAFQRLVRDTSEGPLAAEVGLLTTHAPWTPLPLPVSWDTIGNGEVFDGTQRFGEPLDWSLNPDAVRDMYATSLELTFATIGEYLERHGDNAVFIVLGDHQPAHIIAGWAPNADVPVHIISKTSEVLARLPDTHFNDGVTPLASAAALPMASVRALLATAFEQPLGDSDTQISRVPEQLPEVDPTFDGG